MERGHFRTQDVLITMSLLRSHFPELRKCRELRRDRLMLSDRDGLWFMQFTGC